MADSLPPPNHGDLVATFVDIVVGESADTARQFLNATGWRLEAAIQMFYQNDGQLVPPPPPPPPRYIRGRQVHVDVQPNPMEDTWESNGGDDSLGDLFRPPYELMSHGTFQGIKDEAQRKDKWLLVNVQSTTEFASHVLNRDTWRDQAVSDVIKGSFVFWQYGNDTQEGLKVCTYYRLESLPAVLVIDPITGLKMASWGGEAPPQALLEGMQPFLNQTPSEYLAEQSQKRKSETGEQETGEQETEETGERETGEEMETEAEIENIPIEFPVLPEETTGNDGSVCRVAIRLPNGQRLQRKFLRSDPIQLLWSFCDSKILGESPETKSFQLLQAVPGASKVLDYESKLSLEESNICNSMITLAWD